MSEIKELGYQEFALGGSYTAMPDQPGVKFVVFAPLPDDPSSGAILQFSSCPRADFPSQAQIHPGKTVIEADWSDPNPEAYEMRSGAVVKLEHA